jgi:tetratricopeptide (TPR) repeat protein
MLLFLTVPGSASAADVFVVGSVVNVRSGGGMEHNVIAQVTRGRRLELLGEEGNWSRVRLPGGTEGWIYTPLLSTSPPADRPSADQAQRAERFMKAGNQYFYKGLYEESIGQYRKALELTENDAQLHYNIANSYYREGLAEKAMEEHLKAIGIKPNFLPARNNLALIYFEQGKYGKAVEEWEKALDYDPQDIEVNYNLAHGYEKVDMDKAVTQWKRYLELAEGKSDEAGFVVKVKEHLRRLLED